jgi:hypothetical protein
MKVTFHCHAVNYNYSYRGPGSTVLVFSNVNGLVHLGFQQVGHSQRGLHTTM